jgi:alkaline phosphatase D
MAPRIDRRTFLRLMAVTVAAGAPRLGGCGGDDGDAELPESELVFPQGIASGDPRPDSVVLWTRIGAATAPLEVEYVVALDAGLRRVVARGTVTTDATRNYTVKIKPVGLDPYTKYFYRFRASGFSSPLGETKTAPAADQDVNVRFAFASCQDFNGRYYHAWQALVDREPDLDFVVHLGDYVYETAGDPQFQTPDAARQIFLPDGQPAGPGDNPAVAAATLADYRSLYRQYRSDANLRRAHQKYPFIVIWDDHEFSNDCWQDHATYFNDLQDEKQPQRREAADQAWFEYQPADVPFTEGAPFPDDIRIYRSLRYGKHVDLFLTDERFYRSDHVIPEGPVDLTVGKFAPNSPLGSRNFALKTGFDPREAAAQPTMLGAEQKQWLIDGLRASDASWKLWCNEVQLWQMLVDLSAFDMLPAMFRDRFYFTLDQWDGYRSERREIFTAIEGVQNLVALTGDIHAFYAAELYADFDTLGGEPVGVEYVCAGISSQPVQAIVQSVIDANPALAALGLGELVPMFDDILRNTNGAYLRYADSLANGVAVVTVNGAESINVTYLIVPDVRSPDFDGTVERVEFLTVAGTNRVQRLLPE